MFATLISGATQGLIWATLALGVYISYRLLNFADLTCEGGITLGATLSSMLIWKGVNPFVTLIVAAIGGAAAGIVTGLLHTKLKIPPILAGILTMISLYSINIHIMSLATGSKGSANLSLLNFRDKTIYANVSGFIGINKTYTSLIIGIATVVLFVLFLYWFFGTEIGCAIRATGTNEKMCRAQSIDTDFTKICGLALSNALIALCGAMLSQYQGFADVSMGVGSIVIGLASIIIGETIFMRFKSFYMKLLGIAVGAAIYRIVVAIVIYSGMPSENLKLMTAVIVAIALALPIIKSGVLKKFKPRKKEGA